MSDLRTNTFKTWGDDGDDTVPTATLQIYEYINTYLSRGEDKHINRASAASMCRKRRWFQKEGAEGEVLTPRKRVNFLLGDLSEKTMQHFIKEGCVGPGKLYSEVDFGKVIGSFKIQGKDIFVYEQANLVANIGGITVTAHVDGWGKRNADDQWELIECKSASDYGFKDFKELGPKSYINQATVNLQTDMAKRLGAKEVRFFFLKKQTGNLWDRLYSFDETIAKEVEIDYKIANGDSIPKTPYEPIPETYRKSETGRLILPFPCAGYCPYTKKCFPEAQIEWKAGQNGLKPIYIISNKKESL